MPDGENLTDHEYLQLREAESLWRQSERILNLLRTNDPGSQTPPDDKFLLQWACGSKTPVAE